MKTPELLRLGHFAPHPSSSFSERFGPLHLAHSHQAQVPRKTGQKCLQEQEESPTSITHPAPYLAALALFRSSCSHYLCWSRRFCWNKESKQLFRACVTTMPIRSCTCRFPGAIEERARTCAESSAAPGRPTLRWESP